MCLALMGVVASVSGLNVAQTALADDLGASQGQVLWMINGYTLALAALLLPIGAIGDRIGRKPVLTAGLTLFVTANIASAFATSPGMLIATRSLAGVAAAMIMPVTLSVITSSFPSEQRARAVGTWAGVAGASGIIGLVSSAAVVDYASWPWVFVVPVVIGLLSLVLTLRVVRNSREHTTHAFDLPGSLLSVLAVGGIVLGIHEGPEAGWTSTITLAGLIVGAVAAVAFVAWELRHPHPLLDIRVFRNRSLAAGSVGLVALFAVMFALFLVLVQYLQVVLEWSALRSAAALLPLAAVLMPLSTLSPRIAARLGIRSTLTAGAVFVAAGLAWMALSAGVDAGYLGILPGMLVVGLGMGLSMSPSTSAITDSLPADQQGVASALNDTVRELGSSLGIALIGSVLSAGYTAGVSGATDGLAPELARQVEEGIGGAAAAAPQLGADAGPVLSAARSAFVDGWASAMWVSVAIAVAAGIYVFVRAPRRHEDLAVTTVGRGPDLDEELRRLTGDVPAAVTATD